MKRITAMSITIKSTGYNRTNHSRMISIIMIIIMIIIRRNYINDNNDNTTSTKMLIMIIINYTHDNNTNNTNNISLNIRLQKQALEVALPTTSLVLVNAPNGVTFYASNKINVPVN